MVLDDHLRMTYRPRESGIQLAWSRLFSVKSRTGGEYYCFRALVPLMASGGIHSLTAWESRGSQEPGVSIVLDFLSKGVAWQLHVLAYWRRHERGVDVTGQLERSLLHRLDESRPWNLDQKSQIPLPQHILITTAAVSKRVDAKPDKRAMKRQNQGDTLGSSHFQKRKR